MSDVTLNFSSQWPSLQVVKVVDEPYTNGEVISMENYERRIYHGLGYVPFAIGFEDAATYSNPMKGLDVDENYVYFNRTSDVDISCVVIYALDISKAFDYASYDSAIGETYRDDSNTDIDLRKFLLHSRAVSPMALNISTKNYTSSDKTLTYTSPLAYPTFQFGYLRRSLSTQPTTIGIWRNAPLQSQSFPKMTTDGFTSTMQTSTFGIGGELVCDVGTIVTFRNPAIITNNEVSVSV